MSSDAVSNVGSRTSQTTSVVETIDAMSLDEALNLAVGSARSEGW